MADFQHPNDYWAAYLNMRVVSFRVYNLKIDIKINTISSRRGLRFDPGEIGIFSVCDRTGEA